MSWWPFGKKQPDESAAQDVSKPTTIESGLGKTSRRFNERLKDIFVRKKLNNEALEQLEELLIMTDMGAALSAQICTSLAKEKFDKDISDDEVKTFVATQIAGKLVPFASSLAIKKEFQPHIILVCGVNGTGKTTTIGKLAAQYRANHLKVTIAACDTFRAAATEQLEAWAVRAGVSIVKGESGADPASVAYTAIQKAKEEKADVLLIDTAGRLQNKKNLMEELAKIIRVIQKIDPTAPHDSVIVLDATTGQNAISQVQTFKEMVNISGIIMTKLDGTAKGGIIVHLADKFALPIHAIGIGEQIDDLKPFDGTHFAKALVGLE